MKKLTSIESISCWASDFGNGNIEADIIVTGNIDATIEIAMVNRNDELESAGVKVISCRDENGNDIEWTADEINAWGDAVIESAGVFNRYERAVFKAQRDRAEDPDDGY